MSVPLTRNLDCSKFALNIVSGSTYSDIDPIFPGPNAAINATQTASLGPQIGQVTGSWVSPIFDTSKCDYVTFQLTVSASNVNTMTGSWAVQGTNDIGLPFNYSLRGPGVGWEYMSTSVGNPPGNIYNWSTIYSASNINGAQQTGTPYYASLAQGAACWRAMRVTWTQTTAGSGSMIMGVFGKGDAVR